MPAPLHRVAAALALCLAGTVVAQAAAAQTFGGRVLDRGTGLPLRGALVTLHDSAGAQHARAVADSTGIFYVAAPGAGRYRLRFSVGVGSAGETPLVAVAADGFEQGEYALDVDPDPVYFEFQVERAAAALVVVEPGYPPALQRRGISGRVVAQFVVDTTGRVVPATFTTVESTDSLFSRAVREAVVRMRFEPAQLRGRPVRQLVHEPFVFRSAAAVAQLAVGTTPADSGRARYEFEVERPVVARNTASPSYPSRMQAEGLGGRVIAQFVVDTTGQVEQETFRVIESTDVEFTIAVRRSLPRMRFEPAEVRGRKVRQLVQQPFVFSMGRGVQLPPSMRPGAPPFGASITDPTRRPPTGVPPA